MGNSKFKLNNSLAKNIADSVNKVDAKIGFGIRNIDINLLIPSEKNFYKITDIEELAEDIEQNGLYHNLIVRKLNGEKYEIISGERRYKALKMLSDKGNEKFSKVPCQVRDLNDIDAEIILIQANAKARELTDMEKVEQIQRLEELYKYKKSKGEKIPGKIRDHIGKDMGLSGIQVQRYKKIGKDLIPELKEMLETKRIGMAEAAEISSLEQDKQKAVFEFLKTNSNLKGNEAKEKILNNENIKDELKDKVLNLDKDENINKHVETDNNKINKDLDKEIPQNNSINIEKETSNINSNVEKKIEVLDVIKSLDLIKNSIEEIDENSLIKLEKTIKSFLDYYEKHKSVS